PIPDLRYEYSYVRSIRRYVHNLYEKSRKKEKTDVGVVVQPETRPSEVITVQWAPLLWVTIRDQVLGPLIQGCVW
ncbi:hypothetical protein K435DRAFT_580433, partial [Dendrothele bispora CBS 962.96]